MEISSLVEIGNSFEQPVWANPPAGLKTVPVELRRNRNAGHNGPPASEEVPNQVGAGRNPPRRRHVWTPELREELLTIHEAASPARRGYMARAHALWCEAHPELNYMTQQNLRDQIAFLKKQVPQQRGVEQQDAPPASHEPPQVEDEQVRDVLPPTRDFLVEFRAALGTIEDRNIKIHYKLRPRAEDLAQMDGILRDHLTPDHDLWDISCAVYAAASVLCPARKNNYNVFKDERRIQQLKKKVLVARREASRIQCVIYALKNNLRPSAKLRRIMNSLRARYHTLNLSTLTLLKSKAVDKIRALSLAKRKLVNKVRWIKENNSFTSNPSNLFRTKGKLPDNPPSPEITEEFWKGIYESATPVQDTPVLAQFQRYCDEHLPQPGDCHPVTDAEIRRALRGKRNFSAPGVDTINNFWWKSFPSVHPHLSRVFTEYLSGHVPIPAWLVEGRTVLVPKSGDLSRPQNYRPITCLNTLYKIFTSVLNERILGSIQPVWNSVYEQRGSKRGLAGCKDNLLVDRCVCNDAVHYKRNLSMAWVDYAKAFDTTSHELIIRLLGDLHVHPDIVGCIESVMLLWKTRFAISTGTEVVSTGWVTFQRGVFQGDTLSPLLFCISLLPLSIELRKGKGYMAGPCSRRQHKVTHLFYMDDLKIYAGTKRGLQISLDTVSAYSNAIGMSLGLDKCAAYHLNRGRALGEGDGVQLVDGNIIRHLDVGESYKFLGILQSGVQDVSAIKKTLRSRYKARLRQIWSSQLSGKNKVAATNMLAVPILVYSFGVLKWNVAELQVLDRETRKIMNINRSLHPKSSVQRIYLPRQHGGRGLLSLECLHDRIVLDTANRVLKGTDPLMRFVSTHEFTGNGAFLFQAARRAAEKLGLLDISPDRRRADGAPNLGERVAPISARIKKAEEDRLMREHMGKAMHSQFYRHVQQEDLSRDLTFAFLKSAGLKSETEGFVLACQDGVLNTLMYRRTVFKENIPTSCRACKAHPETLMHILSACPTYAVSLYIRRHNAALRVVYYHLRHAFGIDQTPVVPYVPDEVESVVENSRCRLYWNYAFPTTRRLEANKPDIVLLDIENKRLYVIEFSCPAERNITNKEVEKREKYRDLLSELGKLYPGHVVKLVVLIVGVLGGMKADFVRELDIIPACRPVSASLACKIQKAAILGSLHIARAHEVV